MKKRGKSKHHRRHYRPHNKNKQHTKKKKYNISKKIKNRQKREINKIDIIIVFLSIVSTAVLITAILKLNEILLTAGLISTIITLGTIGISAISLIKKLKKHRKKEKKKSKEIILYTKKSKKNKPKKPLSLGQIPIITAWVISIALLIYSFIQRQKIMFYISLGLTLLTIIWTIIKIKKENKKNISEGKTALSKIKEELNTKPKKYETDLDKLYNILEKHHSIKFSDIEKIFGIEQKKVEEWVNILQENELAEIYYPTIGEPELRWKK